MDELTPYAAAEPEARTAFVLPLLAAAVLLALIGVITAATGGDDDLGDPLGRLQAAPSVMRDTGSARMTMSMAMDMGSMSMDVDAEGLVDFVTGAGTFSMDLMGQTMEMRTDGETMWMRLPAIARPTAATEWIEMPMAAVPGAQASQPMPGIGSDSYFDALLGVTGEVEDLGREEVNGVETTRYRFTVDLAEALERVDAEDRDEMEAAFAQAGDVTEMPVEAWLSDDGVPIRQVMTFAADQAGTAMTMRMQIDLSDFGVEVDVQPPPAEDVTRFDDPAELEQMFGESTVEAELEVEAA